MPIELVRQIVEASIEFGYMASKNGVSLEVAIRRYNEILDELAVKWAKEKS